MQTASRGRRSNAAFVVADTHRPRTPARRDLGLPTVDSARAPRAATPGYLEPLAPSRPDLTRRWRMPPQAAPPGPRPSRWPCGVPPPRPPRLWRRGRFDFHRRDRLGARRPAATRARGAPGLAVAGDLGERPRWPLAARGRGVPMLS